jgi:hypothetical protein
MTYDLPTSKTRYPKRIDLTEAEYELLLELLEECRAGPGRALFETLYTNVKNATDLNK